MEASSPTRKLKCSMFRLIGVLRFGERDGASPAIAWRVQTFGTNRVFLAARQHARVRGERDGVSPADAWRVQTYVTNRVFLAARQHARVRGERDGVSPAIAWRVQTFL